MIDSKGFRQAMGKFATGITVVSAENITTNEVRGITVNAFMSLSLDPYLVSISLRKNTAMAESLAKTEQFGISILAEEQRDYSMIFSNQKKTTKPVEFDFINHTPVIPDALVQMVCEKQSEVEAGDHVVFIAKVNEIETREGKPLIYYGSHYRKLQ